MRSVTGSVVCLVGLVVVSAAAEERHPRLQALLDAASAPTAPTAAEEGQAPWQVAREIFMTGTEAFPILREGLADTSPVVRYWTVQVLRRFVRRTGGEVPSTVEELLASALDDPNPDVRFHAATSLGEMGGGAHAPRVAAILTERLEDTDPTTVRDATWLLYPIGGREAVPHLIRNLTREDLAVRRATLAVLRKITGKSFGFDLRSPDGMFLGTDEFLGILSDKKDEEERIENETAEEYAERVASLEFAWTENREALERKRRQRLRRLQETTANQIERAWMAARTGQSEHWEETVRSWKVWWSENRDEERITWLHETLANPASDPAVREEVAVTLGELAESESLPHLVGALGDPENRVRIQAARSIGNLWTREGIPPLIEALARSHEEENVLVSMEIARSLRKLSGAPYAAYPPYWNEWKDRSWNFHPSEGYPTEGTDGPRRDGDRAFQVGEFWYLRDYAIAAAPDGARPESGRVRLELRRWIPSEKRWFLTETEAGEGGTVETDEVAFRPVDAEGYRTLLRFAFTPRVAVESVEPGIRPDGTEGVRVILRDLDAEEGDDGAFHTIWVP